jgi:hypothetical protein
MDQQQGQVNRSIKDLNMKLGDLGSIIQEKGPALKMKQVTTIIPGRESEGEVTVSIETVKSMAQNLANRFQYDMPPTAQKDVNNLYDGLVKAIDVGNQFNPWAGGRRRGTKRRGTKRRGTKRRGTKRRRSSRK